MKRAATILGSIVLTLAASHTALAAETLPVAGSPALRYLLAPHVERISASSKVELEVEPVGTAQAMLDVLDGKASVAGVVMTLPEAVAAAREAAWSEGRMLMVPAGLTYHQVGTLERGARPIGFVTVSAPSPQLLKVLAYLRSESGREVFAGR
jgi:hypothetical protein